MTYPIRSKINILNIMKITFIKPSMLDAYSGDALEPLVFGILAALTPADIDLRLFDERIESIDFNAPTDLVAISCDTFSARRGYQIAAAYRRRGVPVVMGGFHPTLHPEESLRFVETIVVGDAEDTWPAIVEDARRGCLQRVYQSHFPSLDGLHLDRSIFTGKKYGPMRLVQVGRGCCHNCDFCSIQAFYRNSIRYRPVEEILEEILDLRSRAIIFTDDNLFANKSLAMDLLNRLIPLRIRWSCQATLDIAADDNLLDLMARSGCLAVTMGLESLRNDNLDLMRKAQAQKSDTYTQKISNLNRHGIMVYASFIFGYDHDTVEDFDATLDFTLRNRLFLANFNPLTPTPGTPLYDRLEAEGRLIHNPWWLDSTYRYGQATFHPRAMTARELTDGIFRVRRHFNSFTNIIRRGLGARANRRNVVNAGVYLAVNLINRREIYRKQGLPFGHPEPLEPILESKPI